MSGQEVKSGRRPPWVGLAAAVWVLFAAGNNYSFALFSPALKSVLGYTQRQIAILGVANDLGTNTGIFAGIALNYFSPCQVISFGSVVCFLGYGIIWLAVTQTAQNVPYALLWVALLVGSNSVSWYQTAVVVTNMRNFPRSRGTVSGILKAYVGLSAAIYAVLYSAVLDKSDSAFLLFHAVGLPVICFFVMFFIRRCTPASREDSSEEHMLFCFIQLASIFLAIYLLTISILNDKFSVGKPVSYVLFGIMLLLMLAPLLVPVKLTLFPPAETPSSDPFQVNNGAAEEGFYSALSPGDVLDTAEASGGSDLTRSSCPDENVLEAKDDPQEDGGKSENDEAEPLLKEDPSERSHVSILESGLATSSVNLLLAIGLGGKPRRKENYRLDEAMMKANFWLLWLVYFLGVGSGVTVLNNLSQIGFAVGERDTTILMSLFAFFNFLGRLGGGDLSERMVRSRNIPRTMLLTIIQAIMVLSFTLYTLSDTHRATLYSATILLGICYGVHSAVMTPTASELFGLEHVGVIYNFIQLGNPIGASLFSVLLAGNLYDAEAKRQGVLTCLGPSCFRLTFVILAGVSAVGFVLSFILTVRIKSVYERLYPCMR